MHLSAPLALFWQPSSIWASLSLTMAISRWSQKVIFFNQKYLIFFVSAQQHDKIA
jgi:hypothetical protein